MDCKPVATYAGDAELFASLESGITQGLPQECVEWRRSYGRTPKPVYVEVSFAKFTEESLPSEGDCSILGKPFFHIYWTECTDIEKYKQTEKNNINEWMHFLRLRNIQDWLIVVVEHQDSKRVNESIKTKLLSRTTVVEKIKSDFPSKNGERCMTLLDPFRNDARAAESWNVLLQKLRHLLLQSYNTQLGWYEDHVRAQREKRNEAGWNFLDFLFLQEELAFVFYTLGVFEDALVQYDELDALFTQFVINSASGEVPEWLNQFHHRCDTWPGLCFKRETAAVLREKLEGGNASLLDLRCYLFSRQCSLLLLLCRPWEMAQRSLPFLHNCLSELKSLEIEMIPGSVASWVILSCLEILQNCERFSDSTQVESYSLYTVEMWAYVREKLHELGVLCGLMPGMETTSQQLHLVVNLISGMGQDPYLDRNPPSPQARLAEAISSKEYFLKHYLEISELTMGTYKHIGRKRSASLIGKDLASLYSKMGEPEKAVGFLTKLLQIYYRENWNILIGVTLKDLAECYEMLGDKTKFLKNCTKLATLPVLSAEERSNHLEKCLSMMEEVESNVAMKSDRFIQVLNAEIISPLCKVITSDSEIELLLSVCSFFPEEVKFHEVAATLAETPKEHFAKDAKRTDVLAKHFRNNGSYNSKLHIVVRYEPDSEGNMASKVLCCNTNQILSRQDSHGAGLYKEAQVKEADATLTLKTFSVTLNPGMNSLRIKKAGLKTGSYAVSEVQFKWQKVHFFHTFDFYPPSFTVVHEPLSFLIKSVNRTSIAGITQPFVLIVKSGSSAIPEKTLVSLKPSENGLSVLSDGIWKPTMKVELPSLPPFQTTEISFCLMAQLGPQKNANLIEYSIMVECELTEPSKFPVNFLPPFMTTHKLHTCNTRKFIQVLVQGLIQESFMLSNVALRSSNDAAVRFKLLNPSDQTLLVNNNQQVSLLWEFENDRLGNPLKFVFSVIYTEARDNPYSPRPQYSYEFRQSGFETFFTVRSAVEPLGSSEFCRVGTMCSMNVQINRVNPSPHTSLMYEVVADQALWSVCGKTAGVVEIDENSMQGVAFDVMPLTGGFLPLPVVRLSKYVMTEHAKTSESNTSLARLEPFAPGQIYNWSRAMQVHVLPATNNEIASQKNM